MKKVNLYIHIPFCYSKCSYCSLYSKERVNSAGINRFVECLEEEIKIKIRKLNLKSDFIIDSITIGGGTPTYLNLSQLKRLMRIVSLLGKPLKDFSCEANPYKLDTRKLKLLKKFGVNRLSFGVQTNNRIILEYLNRSFSKNPDRIILRALKWGFKVNLDYIIGLPLQKIEDVKASIEFIKKVMPTSITISSLSIGTKKMVVSKRTGKICSFEDTSKMYNLFKKGLQDLGYLRLLNEYFSLINEVPFSVPISNLFNEKLVGFGPFSVSCINNQLIKNVSDINSYCRYISKGSIPCFKLKLDKKVKSILYLMRLEFKKINLREFKDKFSVSIFDLFDEEIRLCIKKGYICLLSSELFLTEKGIDNVQEMQHILFKKYWGVLRRIQELCSQNYFKTMPRMK